MSNVIDWGLWDETDEAGSFKKLPIGPQIIKVLDITDYVDKQYLKIKIDIDAGEFKGTFTEQEKAFKEYPSVGYIYKSYKPKAYPFLKAFITAIEKSNTGYDFKKSNGDFSTIINKKAVANFAEEEIPFVDDDTNEIIVVNKVREIRSTVALAAGEVKIITDIKKLTDDERDRLVGQQKASVVHEIPQNQPVVKSDDLPF